MTADAFFNDRRDQIVALARRYAVPTIYEFRTLVAAGGLVSYGPDIAASYRQTGVLVSRVLKGEKPADLPVMPNMNVRLARLTVRQPRAMLIC